MQFTTKGTLPLFALVALGAWSAACSREAKYDTRTAERAPTPAPADTTARPATSVTPDEDFAKSAPPPTVSQNGTAELGTGALPDSTNSSTNTPPPIVREPVPTLPSDRDPAAAPGEPSGVTDAQLEQSVRMAFANDAALSSEAKNATVSVSQGVVTLRGTVKTDADKARAETLAQGVAGVARVDNQIEIEPQ